MSLAASAAYVRDTLAGRSKPNRVSFFMWSLGPLIGTGAALSAHADVWATARIFFSGLVPCIILIASFINPKSYLKLTTFDLLCGATSLIALIVWLIIDVPRIAILLAAIADGFATLPTVRKAWQFPETETGLIYIAGFIGTLLVIPSIPRWDIENSAFQIYLIIANVLLIIACYRKRMGW